MQSLSTGRALDDAELDRAFAALADPTRRAILARLAQGDAAVLELAEPFAMSQPAVSKHLAVLESAGLVSRRREGRTRPCHLEPDRLRSLSEWVGSYQEYWERSFERLDDVLEDLQRAEQVEVGVPPEPLQQKASPPSRRPRRTRTNPTEQ
jgi:DNA-binding transcriptional ArsR family regulator